MTRPGKLVTVTVAPLGAGYQIPQVAATPENLRALQQHLDALVEQRLQSGRVHVEVAPNADALVTAALRDPLTRRALTDPPPMICGVDYGVHDSFTVEQRIAHLPTLQQVEAAVNPALVCQARDTARVLTAALADLRVHGVPEERLRGLQEHLAVLQVLIVTLAPAR